ncbi:hypothetical protein ACFL6C_08760 [Myxococcota bacterium]
MRAIAQPSPSTSCFDRSSASLERAGDRIDKEGDAAFRRAGLHAEDTMDHATYAVGHLLGAGANATATLGNVLKGTAYTARAGGHLMAAGGLSVAGVGAAALESLTSAGRWVAKNVARGFAKMANLMTRLLGDGQTTTVRQLEGDANAERVSDRLFSAAGNQVFQASVAMRTAWNAYVEAVGHAVGAGANLVCVAGHTAGVAGHVAAAALEAGTAGVLELAELGTRVAAIGVQYAEAGVQGAREAMIVSARIAAATANLLAQPDQGKVEVSARKQLASFAAEMRRLGIAQPKLDAVPVAAQ